MRKTLSTKMISPDYIYRVLQSDPTSVQEITCDRQAWLNLLPILQIYLWLFIVFNAMDFNKVLQTQLIPSFHGLNNYDGMRGVLCHKAFKTLLRYYSLDVYRLLENDYLNLQSGLEAIYHL